MRRIPLLSFLLILGFTTTVRAQPLPSGDSPGLEALCHVGVGVSDIPRALKFYTGILGLKEAFRVNRADGSPSFIYLQVGGGNTFVELKHEESPQQLKTYHMGFLVKDLQASLHALQAKGYDLAADAFAKASKLAGDNTYYYFIHDPDGNNIELSQLKTDSLQIKTAPALLQFVQDTAHPVENIPTSVTSSNRLDEVPEPWGVLRRLRGGTDKLQRLALGSATMRPGVDFGPVEHSPDEEIIFVGQGHGQILLDGKIIELGPGDSIFVEARHPHVMANHGKEPLVFYWAKWTTK